MKKKIDAKMEIGKEAKLANALEKINPRGKVFEGTVIKKFPKRIVIQFQKTVYVKKYERYAKTRTKLHARLPEAIEDKINIGDYVKIQECRPLSKIIHFVVIEKIKDAVKEKEK